jgi:hypothetical protein
MVDKRDEDLWVISMMVMMVFYNANVIVEYGRRRQGLSNAPLNMKHDNSRIE